MEVALDGDLEPGTDFDGQCRLVLRGRILEGKGHGHHCGRSLWRALQLLEPVMKAVLGQAVLPAVLGLAQACLFPPADMLGPVLVKIGR